MIQVSESLKKYIQEAYIQVFLQKDIYVTKLH